MIYLYDAMFSTKKECSLEYVSELFRMDIDKLKNCLSEKTCLKARRWFLIDDKTPEEIIRGFHSNIKPQFEAWKEIKETNGEYFISSYGRVKDKNGKFLLPYQKTLRNGQKSVRYVRIKIMGSSIEFSICRLVAFYFIVASNKLSFNDFRNYIVLHKNNFAHDDYFANLEVVRSS